MTENTRNKLLVLRHSVGLRVQLRCECRCLGESRGQLRGSWAERVSWPSSWLLSLAPRPSRLQLVAGGQPVLCVICPVILVTPALLQCDTEDTTRVTLSHVSSDVRWDTCGNPLYEVWAREAQDSWPLSLDYCEYEWAGGGAGAWDQPTFASRAVWIFPDHDTFQPCECGRSPGPASDNLLNKIFWLTDFKHGFVQNTDWRNHFIPSILDCMQVVRPRIMSNFRPGPRRGPRTSISTSNGIIPQLHRTLPSDYKRLHMCMEFQFGDKQMDQLQRLTTTSC